MASGNPQDSRITSTPAQSIPLQDLARPPDAAAGSVGDGSSDSSHSRGRSLIPGTVRRMSVGGLAQRYNRIDDVSPSPAGRPSQRGAPGLRLQTPAISEDTRTSFGNGADPVVGSGFVGLSLQGGRGPSTPPPNDQVPLSPYLHSYGDPAEESTSYFGGAGDSDRTPLTDPKYLQPVDGEAGPSSHEYDGSSAQSIRFQTPDSKAKASRLGDDLPGVEAGYGRTRSNSYGVSLSPDDRSRSRSRSPSITASPLLKAGSIVRAMSQRVVNLSNEAELHEQRMRRNTSATDETRPELPPSPHPLNESVNYNAQEPFSAVEKAHAMNFTEVSIGPYQQPNPLKGKSLGIFSPENPLRKRLCDILVNPVTEPTILVLIIIQTILLAVDASKNVYTHPRPPHWGDTKTDWALLVLFTIYTIEILCRIIVSGFIHNAPEYSTIDRERGVRGAIIDKYRTVFAPQRMPSVKKVKDPNSQEFAPSIMRSFTSMQTHPDMPSTTEQLQRQQLARRAFLRHSFNRLDFVAIVAFWMSFALGIGGMEASKHIYVFRMLSCLRILRLLAITNGTSVSPFLSCMPESRLIPLRSSYGV
jgi:hypothetical protein